MPALRSTNGKQGRRYLANLPGLFDIPFVPERSGSSGKPCCKLQLVAGDLFAAGRGATVSPRIHKSHGGLLDENSVENDGEKNGWNDRETFPAGGPGALHFSDREGADRASRRCLRRVFLHALQSAV